MITANKVFQPLGITNNYPFTQTNNGILFTLSFCWSAEDKPTLKLSR